MRNVLFKSVYNDSGSSVELLDLTDLHHVTRIGHLSAGFPTPVGRAGELLMCGLSGETSGLAFYDVSEPENPHLAASCAGATLRPFVLSDRTVLAYSYTDNRMYVLDRIGLSVQGGGEIVPNAPSLSAYPNPFNSSLTIEFGAALGSIGSLRIFDQSGRAVTRTLSSPSGKWTWDAINVPAGVYYLNLQSRDGAITKPVTLVK
jgi:hypothetical protein